jgi:acetyl esterase
MRRAAALAGPPPEVRVEELTVCGRPARQYGDAGPVVVFFHGGRFFSGDLESHDTVCRQLALASGCRVLAIDYRLAPEHKFPAAYDDACNAVAWALERDAVVGVAGDSVGANLAAGAALAHRGLRCQLLVYPMIDAQCGMASHRDFAEGYGPGSADMLRGWREYLPEGTDPRDPRASPLYADDVTGAPPAFVMTAEYDSLRDEGEAYARKTGAKLVRYPGTIHGFFTMGGILAVARRAMADAAGFLRANLSPFPA